MGTKRTVWLAWALCGLTTFLAVVLFGVDLLRVPGSRNVLQLANDALFSLALPVVCAIVAALIVSSQPRNTIGWLLMVPVGLFLVGGPIEEYIQRVALSAPDPTLPLLLIVWFSGWSWVLLIFPLLYILLLFPHGKPPTPRWRWVSVAGIAWAALFVLIVTFSQPLNSNTTPNLTLPNPIGILGDTLEVLSNVWVTGLLVLAVLCVAALFAHYRRANETEREQIKWLLYACAVFVVLYVGGTVSGLTDSTGLAAYIWNVSFGLSLVAFPAAIGVAILRYRLFDIDVIIRRTLVYGTLTAVLALTYLGSVVILQHLFRVFIGERSQLVIVATTLAIAALFQPLRRRIQTFIDRRFYRRKYDATHMLQAFSVRCRDEVDINRLTGELLTTVEETLQPAHVSLWLYDAPPGRKARG